MILHSTKVERMTKTMVIFKRGAIFLCCVRCDPIPPQTSVQRLAHTRNVTTCCSELQSSRMTHTFLRMTKFEIRFLRVLPETNMVDKQRDTDSDRCIVRFQEVAGLILTESRPVLVKWPAYLAIYIYGH